MNIVKELHPVRPQLASSLSFFLKDLQKRTGLCLAIFNYQGKYIDGTTDKNICTLYSKKPKTAAICKECLTMHKESSLKFFSSKCHYGFFTLKIPVIINGNYLASIILYPFFLGEEKKYFQTKAIQDYDFDPIFFKELFNAIPTLSEARLASIREEIDKLIQLLPHFFQEIILEKDKIMALSSSLKYLEKEMARLDKLDNVGKLAASLGHEIRNPLTTIRGFLQLMQKKEELIKYQEYFQLMLSELDRTTDIISNFLNLVKHKETEYALGNLNSIIQSIYPLCLADALNTDKTIKLDLHPIEDFPLKEDEIKQLLLNLVKNGLEAMEKGKTLQIKTLMDKNSVLLAIQDEGCGMPEDVKEKLGTPFFTTKENGTGLGLAICHNIAQKHKARIKIDSSPKGTTVSINFPLQTAN